MKNIDSNKSKPVEGKNKRTNWQAFLGWAFATLFLILLLWGKYGNEVENSVEGSNPENISLQTDLHEARKQLIIQNEMLDILQSKEFQAYTLKGNEAKAPQSFAKLYLDKKAKIAYVDLKGLPIAPQGKAYQLWSLQMEPFKATHIGSIKSTTENKPIFSRFVDFPEVETLCITLEDEEGNKIPTMSQLYVMDVIE